MGALPGTGGNIAALIAYDQAKKTVKHPEVPFGEGAIEGLVAPESANNAACGCPLCVVQADVLRWQEECAPGSFDVIVSNPPYIAPEEMAGLQPELFHEPRMALEAPDGGLAFYKHIAPAYFGALKPGGRLILEIGWRQADAVCALCLSAGYEDVSVRSDLSGNPRCVLARRPIAF